MDDVPTSPDARLGRKQLADALTKAGYPTSQHTLSTLASRGGGPPFSKYARHVIYTWGDGLAWAQSRSTPPRETASEHAALRRAAGIVPGPSHRKKAMPNALPAEAIAMLRAAVRECEANPTEAA